MFIRKTKHMLHAAVCSFLFLNHLPQYIGIFAHNQCRQSDVRIRNKIQSDDQFV